MTEEENSWFWQDYWQQGQLACCLADDLRAGYDGVLADAWADFFESLAGGTSILDICTGNGGAALLAAKAGHNSGRAFDILGADLAAIEPMAYVQAAPELMRAIRFEGGVDAAALPYEDAQFDAVISQFGIEYAGLLRAGPEAARVLKSGGRLRFVIHAAQGIAEAGAREELALVPTLGAAHLHDALRQALIAVDSLTLGHGTRPAADAAVEYFVGEMESLDARLKDHPNQATILTLGRRLLGLFESMETVPVPDILKKVDASERSVEAHLLRLESLAAAAANEGDIIAAIDALEAAGVDAGFHALMDGADMLAWVIEGRKAWPGQ
ncbi:MULTISPECIES: class I SAM-dependent methyltransferase [Kordiimonas]|jgi:SAM-dependent methyltransferase|uniref:class I SAM-dependent methyltransferase n=1 Tax=Kordiimonas TaxID=288021 RepID=UPI00257FBF93|nr:methyltransferase domain-containing protein [Kordiimonas sp. UBA4487]